MIFDVWVPTDAAAIDALCAEDADPRLYRGVAILTPHRGCGQFMVASRQTAWEPFADTCRVAANRPRRLEIDPDKLVCVGFWEENRGVLRLQPGYERQLGIWISRMVDRRELEACDSLANQRQQARQGMRRAMMQGRVGQAEAIARRHGIHHWQAQLRAGRCTVVPYRRRCRSSSPRGLRCGRNRQPLRR